MSNEYGLVLKKVPAGVLCFHTSPNNLRASLRYEMQTVTFGPYSVNICRKVVRIRVNRSTRPRHSCVRHYGDDGLASKTTSQRIEEQARSRLHTMAPLLSGSTLSEDTESSRREHISNTDHRGLLKGTSRASVSAPGPVAAPLLGTGLSDFLTPAPAGECHMTRSHGSVCSIDGEGSLSAICPASFHVSKANVAVAGIFFSRESG
ncbi:hypothetical protein BDZ85DRAFT_257609 [Elsinoe ampelina]|uniref:Uncharacterized protein n=1 Tax=Elsinoe ampelina TaxID=302913 RepID=A0A6A6GJ85_9PEZI|nr:hypothetical protein BDZ85DRAFT_257609 [Elsinoe ampelina]